MIERVAQASPALMDVEEGLNLQHGADPAIPGTAMTGLEQPAVDLLTLVTAGGYRIGKGGLVKLLEIGKQPQLKWMHPCDITLIRQRIFARAVIGIELLYALLGQFLPRQALGQESGKVGLGGFRHQIAMHGGETHRAGFETIEEGIELLFCTLATIFAPEPQQIGLALLVGKLGQILGTARIPVIFQQLGTISLLVEAVADDVPHQAHEGQVDGFPQRIANGRDATVVFLAEVVEGVHATAGKEAFIGTCGILAVQCGLQHHRQASVLGTHQIGDGPAADVVLIGHFDLSQALHRHIAVAVMQLGDNLEIGGQHPQLGGGSQFKLAALIDVKRLVRVVGLHPHLDPFRRLLEQGKAVLHITRLLRREQALTKQAHLGCECRVCQLLQIP